MKNIHLIPTDKLSRLHLGNSGLVLCDFNFCKNTINGQHIFITSDEEIKEVDWCYNIVSKTKFKATKQLIDLINDPNVTLTTNKKIILTTDQDLIKDGIQAIDDEFLEWFVKNPSCESVEVIPLRKSSGYYDEKEVWHWDFLAYKIIIPKEESKQDLEKEMFELEQELDIPSNLRWHNSKPKQETLEEAAERVSKTNSVYETAQDDFYQGFIAGAKWQAKRMYSEEEVYKLLLKHQSTYRSHVRNTGDWSFDIEKWFEQFKKK
jgi:hypothetical protein